MREQGNPDSKNAEQDTLLGSVQEHGRLTTDLRGQRESVRSKIALYFIVGFFTIILIAVLIGWQSGFQVTDYQDMLIAISGILSGPLGFIIGFYFKESSEGNQSSL